jgi:hypothetical protein
MTLARGRKCAVESFLGAYRRGYYSGYYGYDGYRYYYGGYSRQHHADET